MTATNTRRPELHFTPERNWVNDPNGLVFHKGVYHLFFQSNPYGNDWGNMSWGHAISRDLISWEDRPVAILFDDDGGIFSGSVVVDVTNSSGFGTPENPPLVAMYTIAQPGHQAQGLAFSVDDGETWTKYEGNPVLDRGTPDFRDPKVVRYQDAGSQSYWVATCVEANDRQVLFFRSDDLKTWTPLSTFGPIGAVGGVWECPDLFPLRLDGGEEKWVLLVSINPGGIAGGSGTQYFVGDFDGVTFTPLEGEGDPHRWLDFGRDFYAGVTFDGVPDARRILIAWMSNWDYAAAVPTSPWRGGMALPRELTLETVDGRPQLRQSLVGGGPALDIVHTATAGALREARTVLPVTGTTLVIDAVLHARRRLPFRPERARLGRRNVGHDRALRRVVRHGGGRPHVVRRHRLPPSLRERGVGTGDARRRSAHVADRRGCDLGGGVRQRRRGDDHRPRLPEPRRHDGRPAQRGWTRLRRVADRGAPQLAGYSHSMVPGGFDVTSSTTRFTPSTSLVMRFEMVASTS